MTKAVALLSGGLDSTLAVKMIIDQGIEVVALNFTSAFCTCNAGAKNGGGCKSAAIKVANDFGIKVKVVVKGLDYMEIVRNPKHGYGSAINPCMDCRVYMFSRAKDYMEEIGASFIITGEVVGQRPMSQRKDCFAVIEEETDLVGKILRPLSAKHFPLTDAEKEGLVDREKLLAVTGRSRKPQMALAEEFELHDYPCPSGGCLLTEKHFSKKVRDLLDNKEELNNTDLLILKQGRHFRYEGVKVVVSRNETENERIRALAQDGETIVEPIDFPGPVALVGGSVKNGLHDFVGGLISRYATKKEEGKGTLRIIPAPTRQPAPSSSTNSSMPAPTLSTTEEFDAPAPLDEATIERYRIT